MVRNMTDYEKYRAFLAFGVGILVAVSMGFHSCSRNRKQAGEPQKAVGAFLGDAEQDVLKDKERKESDDVVGPKTERKRTRASLEKEYVLRSAEEVFTGEYEKRLGELLADPKRGKEVLEEAKRGGRKALSILTKALKCDRKNVRVQAILVLGNLRKVGREQVEALKDALLLDPDGDVRAYAAKAFVAIKDRSAVSALVRCLSEDPYAQARANAAWALSVIGDGEEVKEAVIKALSDEDAWVRLRAVSAVGRLKIKRAEGELIRLKDDPSPMIRERVSEVLRQLR